MARDLLDRDYTPLWAARACVCTMFQALYPEFLEHRATDFYEPHVGGGSFFKAWTEVDEEFSKRCGWDNSSFLVITDIDPEAPALRVAGYSLDFLQAQGWPGLDVIFGNPPYREAEKHVRHAMSLAQHTFFLLRLGFLESQDRTDFYKAGGLRRVWVLRSRPSFRADGQTDATAYALFWWDTEYNGAPTIGWIDDKRPRKVEREAQKAELASWLEDQCD